MATDFPRRSHLHQARGVSHPVVRMATAIVNREVSQWVAQNVNDDGMAVRVHRYLLSVVQTQLLERSAMDSPISDNVEEPIQDRATGRPCGYLHRECHRTTVDVLDCRGHDPRPTSLM